MAHLQAAVPRLAAHFSSELVLQVQAADRKARNKQPCGADSVRVRTRQV